MTAKSPASLTQFPCQVMIHEMRIMELQEIIVPIYFIPGAVRFKIFLSSWFLVRIYYSVCPINNLSKQAVSSEIFRLKLPDSSCRSFVMIKKNNNSEYKKAHPDGCALKFKYSIHYFFCKKLGIWMLPVVPAGFFADWFCWTNEGGTGLPVGALYVLLPTLVW